jgi:hypothetical protein
MTLFTCSMITRLNTKLFRFLMSAIFFISCSNDKEHKSPNTESREPPSIFHKPNDKDTILIDQESAVFYSPDTIQIEQRKAEVGEENFYIGADDYLWYLHESQQYLEKVNFPTIFVEGKKILKFKSPNKTTLIRLDSLRELWGVYLFKPGKAPYFADIVSMEQEFEKYFK